MEKKLSLKQLMVMGGALFSMHFGAAIMLFPVQWGKEAGTAVWLMFIGALLSVIILPYFGYLALVKGDGTFLQLSRRITPKFGTFFAALTIFVIGPLYMVPRMSAAAWAAILQITGWQFDSYVPVVLFSIVYYLVTYWFVVNPGKVVEKIGNILFPVLIVIVTAVIIKSIISPIAPWTEPEFTQNPLLYGFLQGYATADLQCALIFGVIVVHGIRDAGVKGKEINRSLALIGVVGLGLLAISVLGHMIAGANTGGTIDLTLSALYTEMVLQLWGSAGGILFNIALVAAALTTAIGAVSSTSEIWEEIMLEKNPKLYTYRNFCIVSCVLSCIVSFTDLDTMVKVVGPVLDACYPPAIVIAMYYCVIRKPSDARNLKAGKWAMISAFAVSIIEMLVRYSDMFSLGWDVLAKAYHTLPLSDYSLAWLPVSVVLYALIWCASSFAGKSRDA